MIDSIGKVWKKIRFLLIPEIAVALFFPTFWLFTWTTGSNTFGAIVAALAMYLLVPIYLLKRWSPGGPTGNFLVEVTDTTISVTEPNGNIDSVTFEDLVEIAIYTDDTGPSNEDVWWGLTGRSLGRVIVFPNGAIGEQAAIERFNKLQGFDDKAVIKAMSSTSVARFICWRRSV